MQQPLSDQKRKIKTLKSHLCKEFVEHLDKLERKI